ncbi:MAG: outer membrane lipoprotein carrier protein LolA [Pseudomonadota bacterium]|nr:outer membrane lipoprotein carrier protein LolA [Pseudomonadota bacterium]
MYRFLLFALVTLSAVGALCAESPPATTARTDSARSRLEAFSKGLNELTGSFQQRTVAPDGAVQEDSSGILALRAPRQFRWEYVEPYPQLIVADGDNVWIYDEDLEQVTVRNQSQEEAQSPLTILIDLSQLDRDFKVKSLPASGGLLWLELQSLAKEPAFKTVRIGLGAKSPEQMVLIDLIDNRTEWRFADWKRDPKLDDAKFRFTPPAGVDVVGEPVRGAEVRPLR